MTAPPLAMTRGAVPAVVQRPLPPRRPRRRGVKLPRFIGAWSVAGLFSMVALAGAIQGGHLQTLRQTYGDFHHVAGRIAGFGLQRVTISGQVELNEREIVAAAGVDSRQSLLFLDVAQIRDKILALPLVESASVRKLYPNDLVIDIVEREAYAVWQRDGELKVIASDGTPTEKMRDPRFVDLPLVVGEGANKRAKDFVALLDVAPELRSRIRAGSLIGERRWNLTLANGILVRLPEVDAADAMKRLARAQREQRLLERDVLAIDMRDPDRITVRLAAEPAETRLEAAKKKMGKWMGNDA
ncbi:cell division protein FtsQ/DivIB [Terrarubrum flagellatum]|uniref:cell division protein FtsQ/DivIB n=1 Tax=Terrirubrum flagellatum TaxID=2895980 RepID=UPI00314523F4